MRSDAALLAVLVILGACNALPLGSLFSRKPAPLEDSGVVGPKPIPVPSPIVPGDSPQPTTLAERVKALLPGRRKTVADVVDSRPEPVPVPAVPTVSTEPNTLTERAKFLAGRGKALAGRGKALAERGKTLLVARGKAVIERGKVLLDGRGKTLAGRALRHWQLPLWMLAGYTFHGQVSNEICDKRMEQYFNRTGGAYGNMSTLNRVLTRKRICARIRPEVASVLAGLLYFGVGYVRRNADSLADSLIEGLESVYRRWRVGAQP
ncbi:RNase III domain-containing protein [Plasmodiophora brassicae]|uniref:RNase III domain-containing protein n=1 Tax=Plasmodiophora brassicae TaxID=37360 RepID=A0A3P3XZ18_PLABS|nr:unnamed protein product [Plasmodiophora brassicae]